jgi:hypothetical protein
MQSRTAIRAVKTVVALGLGMTTLSSSGSAAPTTFPGANGKIAVSSSGFGSGAELANPDGSGRTVLPIPGGFRPVWSADGKWLAYSTFPEPWVIRVARSDGSSDREVLPKTAPAPATHYGFAWSPNGSEIAYQCATGLCAVRVSDGTTRRILDTRPAPGGIYPAWSPDGTKIAFHCSGLCVTNADGSDAIVFTAPPGTGLGFFPDWSPDGTRLLLTVRGSVRTLDVDDGELRQLVDLGGDLNARAHWSPDGTSVLISHAGVYLLRLDGSQPVLVPNGVFGDWGTSPAAMVSEARLEPRWVLSRQAGRLVVSGTASHASSLTVTLRSTRRTYPARAASVQAGAYTVSVALPPDLLPGAYEVVVGGTSGDERLLDVSRSVSLQAPASGLVASSRIVKRGPGRLAARFAFSIRPATGRHPTAVWLTPSRKVRLRERLPKARIVTSTLTVSEPLTRGRWRCRLEVGGTVLAVASLRID